MKNIAASVFVSVGSLRGNEYQTALWRDLVWGGTEASYEEPALTFHHRSESWKSLGSECLELSWEQTLQPPSCLQITAAVLTPGL